MCTCSENIFWYIREVEVFTSIAIIQFNVNDKPVYDFQKPFFLTFQMTTDMAAFIYVHRSATPQIPDSNIPKMYLEFERMSVYRIDVHEKQPFTVEFVDLPSDVTLDVRMNIFFRKKPKFIYRAVFLSTECSVKNGPALRDVLFGQNILSQIDIF